MKSTRALIVAVSAIVTVAAFSPAQPPAAPAGDYSVTNTLRVGGEGRWDYLIIDPATQLLYVPRQTHTQIIKASSGEVVADLANTAGVHGVALVTELGRGFTSNGTSNTVTVFDLKTNQEIGTIPTGKKPDAIIYDPGSRKVLAFCGKSDSVTVIDPSADPAAAKPETIALPGAPESAASDEHGHVYVNLEDKNAVAVIDTKAMKVTATWKIDGGDEPTGIAIDIARHRIFSGCHNQVMAMLDTETGKTLGTVPIGKGVDACTFDPATGEAFASCGDGTLTVAKETSAGKLEAVQTVKTKSSARTVALDATNHVLYLPAADLEPAAEGAKPAAKPGTFAILVVKRAK